MTLKDSENAGTFIKDLEWCVLWPHDTTEGYPHTAR